MKSGLRKIILLIALLFLILAATGYCAALKNPNGAKEIIYQLRTLFSKR